MQQCVENSTCAAHKHGGIGVKQLCAGILVCFTIGQQILTCCLLFIWQCSPRGLSNSLQHIWVRGILLCWRGLGLGLGTVPGEFKTLVQDPVFVFA